MSIRAYRVDEITYKGEKKIGQGLEDSFNLWHDERITGVLDLEGLNEDGCGLMYVPIETLKKALNIKGLDKFTRKRIREDIKFAIDRGDEDVLYHCF